MEKDGLLRYGPRGRLRTRGIWLQLSFQGGEGHFPSVMFPRTVARLAEVNRLSPEGFGWMNLGRDIVGRILSHSGAPN